MCPIYRFHNKFYLNLNNYVSMKHAIVADEGIRTSVDTF